MKIGYAMSWFALSVLVLFPSAVCADSNWDPKSENPTPFESLGVDLSGAVSVLYLNKKCEVLALVAPSVFDLPAYVPLSGVVSKNWWNRTKGFTGYGNCPADPKKMKFLKLTYISGPTGTDPKACDPNELLADDKIFGVLCEIDTAKVESLVVLDDLNQTLVAIEGALAPKASHKGAIPANYVGRPEPAFQIRRPCSPTTPNPCPTGQVGTIKTINNRQVCMCQYP